MRTAVLSVILAVMATAAPQQEPAKPDSQPAQQQAKPPEAPLVVQCAPRTTIQLGVAYDSAIAASGGTGAYQFAVIGGALPAGLALNPSSGAIGGTPTADGTFSFTVQVTDSAGAMATTGSTPCILQPPVASPSAAAPAAVATPKTPAESVPAPKPPVVAQPESDPAKLAQPRDSAIARAALSVPQDEHPFILGAEDQITVLVYGSTEFSGAHLVRPDGKITMPFLGDVVAAGLSPIELGNVVKERLKKYLVEPDVSVSVNQVNSKRFYIQGEVNKTGAFPLLVPTKVLEALVNAGGFRDFANQKKIVIMRMTGERLNFNYKEVIKGKKMDQNIYLKPGDIIIVK
jgi:polysaccharide export outer membrane protein